MAEATRNYTARMSAAQYPETLALYLTVARIERGRALGFEQVEALQAIKLAVFRILKLTVGFGLG